MERDITAILRTLPFLKDLDAAYLESTIPLFQNRKVKKGSIIFLRAMRGMSSILLNQDLSKYTALMELKP